MELAMFWNFLGYVVGVALHVGVRWANWMQGHPLERRMRYWEGHFGMNLASVLTAAIVFSVWQFSLVPEMLNLGAEVLGIPSDTGVVGAANKFIALVPVNPVTAVFVGGLMDSFARNFWMAREKRAQQGG